jgi:hypothetical protein
MADEGKISTSNQTPATETPVEGKQKTEAEIQIEELTKKFPLSMGLSKLKPKGNKKRNDSYKGFSSIFQDEIDKSSRTFVTLYSMYERRPFLEPVENQETLENVTAEITFGISDDAFRVDVNIAVADCWLVPQDNVGVSFEEGFCEISLEPSPDQYGDVDVFIEVEDVGGVSKHDFTLSIVQDKTKLKKTTMKKKARRFSMKKGGGDDSDDDEYVERSENPNRWNTMNICDWMLEVGLSKYAKFFAQKEIDGKELLKLEGETLRDNFGVKKTRDRDKFVRSILKLREQAEMAEYAEREKKEQEAAREKLRLEKEARRALARGDTSGAGGGGAITNQEDNGLDPWLCGHVPRVTRGECGQVDMDAYGIMYELLKVQKLDQVSLRDATFIDLAATDGRFVMAAAIGLPFFKCVGLQSVEAKRTIAQRFIQRYNTRFRHTMPTSKRNQRISIAPYLPHEYDTLSDGRIFYLHWPILEDLFYKVKERFHYFTDLVSIMGNVRRGSILIITDDDYQSPYPNEEDGVEHAQASKFFFAVLTHFVALLGEIIN